jgi:GT2 family glycosyltransferase
MDAGILTRRSDLMRYLIGMVTFGNLEFTKIAVESVEKTAHFPYDFCFVAGKPDDYETLEYLKSKSPNVIYHNVNKGFPLGLNDIYDFAWKHNNYDGLIVLGNDTYAIPYTLDDLVEQAEATDYVLISASEYSVKDLVAGRPELTSIFAGSNMIISDFSTKPWEEIPSEKENMLITGSCLDLHNFAIWKKEVFDTIGYVDVNFYPAYYEDNDYAIRLARTGLKTGNLNKQYFHFWSRTIHQGSGGSTNQFFLRNKDFYIKKWGGPPGQEGFEIPFNDIPYKLNSMITLPPVINIQSRELEEGITRFWRGD